MYNVNMRNLPKQIKYIIGIDEVGRGPIAGPMTLGAVVVTRAQYLKLGREAWRQSRHGLDSKSMSESRREEYYKLFTKEQREGNILYKTTSVSARTIDKKGITAGARIAISHLLNSIKIHRVVLCKSNCLVLLDGGLMAPASWPHQETIIKGDSKETLIGMASIIAKVTRDRYMRRQHAKYPQYNFASHKGYGTRAHYLVLAKHGPTPLHRLTFISNL